MKEMIKALIADGWNWVAGNSDGSCSVYDNKPVVQDNYFVLEYGNHKYSDIPSCLLPDITFENSPVEIKTLLVDDEENEEQYFIRKILEEDKEAYLLLEHEDIRLGVWVNGKWTEADILIKYNPKEIHEKVYLKDLVKKRKVKKSLWLAVDENGVVRVANEKPIRGCNGIWVDERGYAVHDMSKHTNLLPLSWEDEPKQITIEVEE